jgi:hypothetical protein
MGDRPASATHLGELAGCDWLGPDPDLLVLTDHQRHGQYGLRLPFRDATVLELVSGEMPGISGKFTALVVDRSHLDLGWLAAVIRATVPALRPESPVVVLLGSIGRSPAPPEPVPAAVRLESLRWRGLGTVAGWPAAVLEVSAGPDHPPTPIADLLVTTDLAVRLAAAARPAGGPLGESTRLAHARHLEDRRQSEHALLRRLAGAVSEPGHERRPPGPIAVRVRNLLRRSRSGRAVLRAARPVRRLGHRLRRAAGAW